MDSDVARRFWAKVDKGEALSPGACWIWVGVRATNGYGQISIDDKKVQAHRASVELNRESIPAGLVLDHLCGNKPCVNPAHLEIVTKRENTLRGTSPAAIAARSSTCPRGHEYTPENTVAWPSLSHRKCLTCVRALDRLRYARTIGDPERLARSMVKRRADYARRKAKRLARLSTLPRAHGGEGAPR